MPFQRDEAFAKEVKGFYGKYHVSFVSKSRQVIAHLFEDDGWLVAHVSFSPGFDAATVTDRYWGELDDYAKHHGFEGKLRVLLLEGTVSA
jgi:hypothetical protein